MRNLGPRNTLMAPLSPPLPIRKSESIEVIMPASPRSTMDVFVLTGDDQIHRVRSDDDSVSCAYVSDEASESFSLSMSSFGSAFLLEHTPTINRGLVQDVEEPSPSPSPPPPPPIPSLIVDVSSPVATSTTTGTGTMESIDYTYSEDDGDDHNEELVGLACLPEAFWGCAFLGDGGPEPLWYKAGWNQKTWTIR
ncbi:expressed unknown protein [Seminavis robusta]|uniref:Uncharacterized protein n=1 Tax=Seminavis robusta TaxID=568900 RepID=A0A9N8HZX1_9STRA|nr:expressed unknown protein [Seminavis robusta]|eukprot:Sro3211_g345310.1 n/a (194) ;mRNA; r:3416-3997